VRWAFFCFSFLLLSLLPLSPISVFSVLENDGRWTVEPRSLVRSRRLADEIVRRHTRQFLIRPLMIPIPIPIRPLNLANRPSFVKILSLFPATLPQGHEANRSAG
jgi:hypothetical protein